MRLLRLEFANLGPFQGVHEIDFSALAATLFLIDGPTGAGKSTIIDAIVFALYDRVAGEESDGARLRSLAAGPGDDTYVVLEFEVHDRSFRIRRSPSYQRKALRGEGLTTNKHSVTLEERIGGVWEFREDKAQTVAVAVKDVIGLDRDQFVQTVVLPQGEFARFLNATSAERKPILQRIFTTSGYELIERRFAALADEARAARAQATERLERALAKVEGGLDGVDVEQVAAQVRTLEVTFAAATAEASAAQELLTSARTREAAVTELERADRVLAAAIAELRDVPQAPAGASIDACDAELIIVRTRLRELQELAQGEIAQLERDQRRRDLDRDESKLQMEMRALLATARSIEQHAQAHAEQVAERSSRQRAALVARELRAGAPCPVCGALEHPVPATFPDGDVNVHDALAAVTRAGALLEAVLELTDPTPTQQVAPDADIVAAERERKALQRRASELATRRLELDVQDGAWRERRGQLTATEVDAVVLSERERELDATIATLRRMDAVSANVEKARREQAEASSSPGLRIEAPEVSSAIAIATTRTAEMTRVETELTAARVQLQRARELTAELSAAQAAGAATERETAAVIRIADVVAGRGDNRLSQPLSVFVLQSMFDDVVDAANARLSGMLDGRYELRTVEESADRRRANAGLDLTVVDHAVADEPSRGSRTLSGGETFCVSLALALGLADTVHAYAGGVAMDTLFIDEGFGSLDAGTLDDVMGELERLGQDGRVVGVISHVEAMKAISERIDVVPSDAGSRIRVSWS